MTGEPNPQRLVYEAPDARFDLDRYPLTADAVEGAGFVVEVGVPGNCPAEEDILTASGYRAVLAAGDRTADGGWLVEVYTDETSGTVRNLVPPLRALVAVALTGAGLPA
jgi:hypothetical protein